MKKVVSVSALRRLLFHTARVVAICTVLVVALGGSASIASAQQNDSHLVERTRFDWDHSGTPTIFSLIRSQISKTGGETNRLIISRTGKQSWSFANRDDVWAPLSETELSRFRKQNLVPTSKRFLFVSASSTGDAHVYLILKGAVSGCCVGSLTILTPGDDRKPKVVFHASNHLITAIIPTDDKNALQIIGQSSDSEARALKNAQSYDPFRVYLLQSDHAAEYNLELSKAYTVSHYCQWHGPKYDERFVAVGPPTGSDHCRVMTDQEFGLFQQKHPQFVPE